MAVSHAPRTRSDAVPLRTYRSQGRPAAIAGVGVHLPDRVLTNQDLEQMVDTSDKWITERTGIKERRVAEPGTPDVRVGHRRGTGRAGADRDAAGGPGHDPGGHVHTRRPVSERRLPRAERVGHSRLLRDGRAGRLQRLRLRALARRCLHRERAGRHDPRDRRRGADASGRLDGPGHLRALRGRRWSGGRAPRPAWRRLPELVPRRGRPGLRQDHVRRRRAGRVRGR